jgi:hypothetical protein
VPNLHIAVRRVELEMFYDEVVDVLGFEREGEFVDRSLDIYLFDYGLYGDVAKEGELLAHLICHWLFGAANENVGLDSDFTKFGHRLLAGLCLELARGL